MKLFNKIRSALDIRLTTKTVVTGGLLLLNFSSSTALHVSIVISGTCLLLSLATTIISEKLSSLSVKKEQQSSTSLVF